MSKPEIKESMTPEDFVAILKGHGLDLCDLDLLYSQYERYNYASKNFIKDVLNKQVLTFIPPISFDITAYKKIHTPDRMLSYLYAIQAISIYHGLSISHECTDGSFLIEEGDHGNIAWLINADKNYVNEEEIGGSKMRDESQTCNKCSRAVVCKYKDRVSEVVNRVDTIVAQDGVEPEITIAAYCKLFSREAGLTR